MIYIYNFTLNHDIIQQNKTKLWSSAMSNQHLFSKLIDVLNNNKINEAHMLFKTELPANSKNPTGGRPIMYAVGKEFTDLVESLINNYKVEVNVFTNEGIAPVMLAGLKGNLQIMQMLIDAGADVNCTDGKGQSPLFYAIQGQNTQVVALLLKQGADVHITNDQKETALLQATKYNNLDIVKLLVENGADVNHQSKDAESALMFCAGAGFMDMVKYLVENGADVNLLTLKEKNALMFAAGSGHLDIVKYLVDQGSEIDAQNHVCGDVVMFASFHGQVEIIKYLLDLGLGLDKVDEYGFHPMIVAVQEDKLPMVKYLLDQGLNLDQPCAIELWSPLMYSVFNNYHELSEFILSQNVDVNHQGVNGKTALMLAVQEDFDHLTRLLLEQPNIDLNKVDKLGWNPLMFAVMNGNFKMIQFLLKYNPEWAKQTDNENQTAHDMAKKEGYQNICNLFNNL